MGDCGYDCDYEVIYREGYIVVNMRYDEKITDCDEKATEYGKYIYTTQNI